MFLVFVLVVMICQAACDHRRPCSSFLTNSFFSCKDRALERDRPYRRKKKAKAARARLLGLCGFLPPAPAAFPGVLSFFLLASACLLPPAPLFFLGWFCPPRCFLSCLVLLASPLLVGLAFSCVCLVLLCVVCRCLLSRFCVFVL